METAGVNLNKPAARRWTDYGIRFHFKRRISASTLVFASSVLLIMGLGAALRLWSLGSANLWTDEAWTAGRVHSSLDNSVDTILGVRNHGPIYFMMLRLFPNSTDALLRFPSVLLGMAGIALMIYAVSWLTHDREKALWAGLLVAVNPFHVSLSRTARPYAMVFFLALFISFIFLLLLSGRQSRKLWFAFAITSLIAYGTHYSTAALLAAQYVVFGFILRGKVHIFRRWAAAQAVAAVPTLIWVFLSLRNPVKIVTEWIPHPGLRDLPLSIWNLMLGYDGVFKWQLVPGLVLVTLGLALGVRITLRDRAKNYHNLYWLALILVALIPVYIMSRYVISIYVDRYFTIFLPGLLILLIEGWMSFPPLVRRLALGAVVATCLYVTLLSFYDGSYRREDWRAAAKYIASNAQTGDAILVERDNIDETFSYYFNPLRHIGTPEASLRIVRLTEMPDTTPLEQSATRLWVIYRNPNEDVHRLGIMPDFNPFDANRMPIAAWLVARRGEIIQTQKYHGMYIFLLDTQQKTTAK